MPLLGARFREEQEGGAARSPSDVDVKAARLKLSLSIRESLAFTQRAAALEIGRPISLPALPSSSFTHFQAIPIPSRRITACASRVSMGLCHYERTV